MSGPLDVCVIGAMNLDLVTRVAALPKPGETVLADSLARAPGGKGLNQAVAAARAGARARLVSHAGLDEPGDWLLDFLGAEGVDISAIGRSDAAPTGQAYITIDARGENQIVVAAGANLALDAAEVSADRIGGARVLLGQLETAIAPVAKLFASAPAEGLKLLNAAPALAQGATLFPLSDVLIVNQGELAAYAGVAHAPETHAALAALARRLLCRERQTVIVTLGAAGALAVDRHRLDHVPGRRVRAVDTVGAGDCFCGVLAAGLAQGRPLVDALRRANVAAALAVTRPGVAASMPTLAEIDAAAG